MHTSFGRNQVAMSPLIAETTDLLRNFLFENIYLNSAAKQEESKVHDLISMLFHYYLEHGERFQDAENPRQEIADYIAGMTDRFAIEEFKLRFLPRGWGGDGHSSFF